MKSTIRTLAVLAIFGTSFSAFGETIENPAWGQLSPDEQVLSLTSAKVLKATGYADELGDVRLTFTDDLTLNFLGNWNLGKQYESLFAAKGSIAKSSLLSEGGDGELNDQLRSVIPESIKYDHSNAPVSTSKMNYPFTPYCSLDLKNPDDMKEDQLMVARAGKTLKFNETRAFRYQKGDKVVAVFNAFNWDKVRGMYIQLNCYAPAPNAISKPDLENLLQSIFGDNARVSLSKSYEQLSQKCSAYKLAGSDSFQGNTSTGSDDSLTANLPEIVHGLLKSTKPVTNQEYSDRAKFLECLLDNGLETNSVGAGNDGWESAVCQTMGAHEYKMTADIAKRGGLAIDQREKMGMLWAVVNQYDDPNIIAAFWNKRTFTDSSASCVQQASTSSQPVNCPAPEYHICKSAMADASFGDVAGAAIDNGHNKMVAYLLSHNMASANDLTIPGIDWTISQDRSSLTLFADAVRVGNLDAAKILASAGAQIDLTTKLSTDPNWEKTFKGETLLDFAERLAKGPDGEKYSEIQAYLNSQQPWYKRWF